MTPDTFIFFGIVGSGKGTQVEILKKYLQSKDDNGKIINFSTGALFRALAENGTYAGNMIKDSLEKGLLLPNFLTTSLFVSTLISDMSQESILISDGFPRTISQSESFDSVMQFYNRANVKVIYIELSKEAAMRRMKLRGRSDDTDEAIAKRFDEYVNNVLPSMDYFKDKPGYTIHAINGEQSIEDVHKDIIKALNI